MSKEAWILLERKQCPYVRRSEGNEIRDASAYRPNWSPDPTRLRPDRTVGQSFLGAERNIMDNKGLFLNSNGTGASGFVGGLFSIQS
jgi:hypothetical protein